MFTGAVFLVIVSALFFFSQLTKTKEQSTARQESESTFENAQTAIATPTPVIDNRREAQKVVPAVIPILMYHYIRDYSNLNDPIGGNLSVSPEKFEQQIAWLVSNNYQTVSLSFFKNPESINFKPIILTFDDGYQDAYGVAFPILKKYQMVGMFYLIVNKIGTPGYLTWDEIMQMQTEGMSFGSHTLSHPDLRNLSKISLHKELEESKKILEQKLGKEITDFCYPSGKYNTVVLKELKNDNYQTAVTTHSGISSLKENLFLLKRLRITESTNIQAIVGK